MKENRLSSKWRRLLPLILLALMMGIALLLETFRFGAPVVAPKVPLALLLARALLSRR